MKNAYVCDVCQQPFIWSDDSAYQIVPCLDEGAGYERNFHTCSEDCRKIKNLKPAFLEWQGGSKISKIFIKSFFSEK